LDQRPQALRAVITSSPEKTRKDKISVTIAWMRTFPVPKKAEGPAKSLSWARSVVFALAAWA